MGRVDDMANPDSPNYHESGHPKAGPGQGRNINPGAERSGCATVTLPVVGVPLALAVLALPGTVAHLGGTLLGLGSLVAAASLYGRRHRDCCRTAAADRSRADLVGGGQR